MGGAIPGDWKQSPSHRRPMGVARGLGLGAKPPAAGVKGFGDFYDFSTKITHF